MFMFMLLLIFMLVFMSCIRMLMFVFHYEFLPSLIRRPATKKTTSLFPP